jgi:hypothetical protein
MNEEFNTRSSQEEYLISDLTVRFWTSAGEHEPESCWCRHPASAHEWDPVRDYREYLCLACQDKA